MPPKDDRTGAEDAGYEEVLIGERSPCSGADGMLVGSDIKE